MAAKQLQQSPEPDDQALADGIQGFVAVMPKIDTERHEPMARLVERFSQQRDKSREGIGDVEVPKINAGKEKKRTRRMMLERI